MERADTAMTRRTLKSELRTPFTIYSLQKAPKIPRVAALEKISIQRLSPPPILCLTFSILLANTQVTISHPQALMVIVHQALESSTMDNACVISPPRALTPTEAAVSSVVAPPMTDRRSQEIGPPNSATRPIMTINTPKAGPIAETTPARSARLHCFLVEIDFSDFRSPSGKSKE